MRVLYLIVLLTATSAQGAVVDVFQYQSLPATNGNGQPQIQFSGATLAGTFAVPDLMFGPNFFPLGLANNFGTDIFANINVAATGSYTFQTTSDDGSVLLIDGQAVVNNNFFQGATTRSGSITLTAGLHSMEVQYFQGGGGAELSVPLPSGVTYADSVVLPYLNIYSANTSPIPVYPVVQPPDQFVCSLPASVLNYQTHPPGFNWSPCGLSNNFVAELQAYFDVAADGIYTFSTSSDDGSWLVIDGSIVVNNGFYQGYTQRSGTVFLTAGQHLFDLQYFQGGGGAALDLTVPAGVTIEALPEPSTMVLLAIPLILITSIRLVYRGTSFARTLFERCHDDAVDENLALCCDCADRSRSGTLLH